MTVPTAIEPLLRLASELRSQGCAIAPEQTMQFIEAVKLLGPAHINHIRLAGLACFAIDPDQMPIYEAVFRRIFYGQSIAAKADSSDEDVDAYEPTSGSQTVDAQESQSDTGGEATEIEHLGFREFRTPTDLSVLEDFRRRAGSRLPRRNSYRWKRHNKGKKIDLRRVVKLSVNRDGEMMELKYLARKVRLRRILLLIDISGSMKEVSRSNLLVAHSLVQTSDNVEVFTLGTRLTRISSALKVKQVDQALDRVSGLVADFDGGTRIGDALQAYLSVPRFAGFSRSAAVIVLSDGLERGDAYELVDAVRQLAKSAWRFSWLTPLAQDSDYTVQTEALRQVLPFVDEVSSGHSVEQICSYVLNMAKAA